MKLIVEMAQLKEILATILEVTAVQIKELLNVLIKNVPTQVEVRPLLLLLVLIPIIAPILRNARIIQLRTNALIKVGVVMISAITVQYVMMKVFVRMMFAVIMFVKIMFLNQIFAQMVSVQIVKVVLIWVAIKPIALITHVSTLQILPHGLTVLTLNV